MAVEHRALSRWMIDVLDPAEGGTVLDLGCGGGMTVRQVASRCPQGRIWGLDHSETMVRQATRRNRDLIRAGRVCVGVGEADALPFADGTFDAVVAVESFQFWNEPLRALREIGRVLRPGGRVAVTLDAGGAPSAAKHEAAVAVRLGAAHYDASALVGLLSQASFVDPRCETRSDAGRSWLCGVAARTP